MAESRKICRINGIGLDVVISETPDMASDVTAFPVEDGEDVADHVHNQPIGVTIEAIVSGTPLDLAGERGDNPITQVRAALEEIRTKRQPFTYEGLRGIYKSMIFESLSFPFDPSTGNSLRISATMRQVNLRELVRVAASFRPAKKSGPPGPGLWLCPPLAAVGREALRPFISFTRAINGNIVKPQKEAAINRRMKCRLIVKRGDAYVFADTGKKLNEDELKRMAVQNNALDNVLRGSAIVSKPPPGTPVIPVAFAPGPPAIKEMSKPPPPVPEVAQLPATAFLRGSGRNAI